MTDKKIDMFKLVEEVEKQRASNIDDIFNDLDSIRKEEAQPSVSPGSTASYQKSSDVRLVRKPSIPEDIGNYTTRFEAFRSIVEHVSYGSTDVNDYMAGHRDALEKYYKDAYNNSRDLYVIEARVNDEINRYTSRYQLYEKGYYDGMFYILKALKRSKELLMARLNKEISEKL